MTEDSSPAAHGMKDASEISNLFSCFEKMGMTKEEMDKIARVNFQNLVKRTIG